MPSSNNRQLALEIKQLILKNHTEQALQKFLDYAKANSTNQYDEAVILQSRYQQLETDNRLGVLSDNDYSTGINKLNRDLLKSLNPPKIIIQRRTQLRVLGFLWLLAGLLATCFMWIKVPSTKAEFKVEANEVVLRGVAPGALFIKNPSINHLYINGFDSITVSADQFMVDNDLDGQFEQALSDLSHLTFKNEEGDFNALQIQGIAKLGNLDFNSKVDLNLKLVNETDAIYELFSKEFIEWQIIPLEDSIEFFISRHFSFVNDFDIPDEGGEMGLKLVKPGNIIFHGQENVLINFSLFDNPVLETNLDVDSIEFIKPNPNPNIEERLSSISQAKLITNIKGEIGISSTQFLKLNNKTPFRLKEIQSQKTIFNCSFSGEDLNLIQIGNTEDSLVSVMPSIMDSLWHNHRDKIIFILSLLVVVSLVFVIINFKTIF